MPKLVTEIRVTLVRKYATQTQSTLIVLAKHLETWRRRRMVTRPCCVRREAWPEARTPEHKTNTVGLLGFGLWCCGVVVSGELDRELTRQRMHCTSSFVLDVVPSTKYYLSHNFRTARLTGSPHRTTLPLVFLFPGQSHSCRRMAQATHSAKFLFPCVKASKSHFTPAFDAF